MSTTAFPVRQSDDGTGCTDIALRHIMGALYPYTGIVAGLNVTGGNTLAYNIAEGVAVCSKGEADGNTLAYYEGGAVDTTANSGSNPRIDVIWITSHDLTQGDSDNLVTVGVTQGTAAASPEEPALEQGQTKLAAMLVPASATTTQGCTAYGTAASATPYGGNLGLLGENQLKQTVTGSSQALKWFSGELPISFYVPTKRLIELTYEASCRCSNNAGPISWGLRAFQIDGTDIDGTTAEFQLESMITEDHKTRVVTTIEAGNHTASVCTGKMSALGNASGAPYVLYGNPGDGSGRFYKGQILRVWDRGPAE